VERQAGDRRVPGRLLHVPLRKRYVWEGDEVTNSNLETAMNEEPFNLSIRKFLKMVGVNSQREIEHAVARAIADESIAGTETLGAAMTLEIPALGFSVSSAGTSLWTEPAQVEAPQCPGMPVGFTHSESAPSGSMKRPLRRQRDTSSF
jgi:hypothetical protein